jgi:hypothetical protein
MKMTTATELIAEMADFIYTTIPTCFCHARYCSKCENWEQAKKLVDTAGVFADLKSHHGSDGKKPPQGGSVNTPRPPQDAPSVKKVCRFTYRGKGKPDPIPEDAFSNELPWQPGPAMGGGLPPDKQSTVLIDYGDESYNLIKKTRHKGEWGPYPAWHLVTRWLIIK